MGDISLFLYEMFLCFLAVPKSSLGRGGFSSRSAPPQPWDPVADFSPCMSPLPVGLVSEQLSSPAPAAHSPERSGIAFKEISARHCPAAILIPLLTALVLK